MLMSRKEGLKKYLNLILFTLKECLLPLQVLHNKFRKDWPKSSIEIAIGHLSDSGDSKNEGACGLTQAPEFPRNRGGVYAGR